MKITSRFFFRIFTTLLYLWQNVMRFFSLNNFFWQDPGINVLEVRVACSPFFGIFDLLLIEFFYDLICLSTFIAFTNATVTFRPTRKFVEIIELKYCVSSVSIQFLFFEIFLDDRTQKIEKNHCIFSFNEERSKIKLPLLFILL